jgi:hypothetical protein
MKKTYIIMFSILPFLLSSTCKKNNYKNTDSVRLKATISDTSEAIPLGDTLKITLTIPDVLVTELGQNTFVQSLNEGRYIVSCARFDTVNRIGVFISDPSLFFVTEGINVGGNLFVSKTNKPFRSILNIIPPQKGYYRLEITPQPGKLNVNNDSYYGLKVDFNVTNKHWNTLAYYYNVYFNTNISEFLSQNQYLENEGYGFYGFRVN